MVLANVPGVSKSDREVNDVVNFAHESARSIVAQSWLEMLLILPRVQAHTVHVAKTSSFVERLTSSICMFGSGIDTVASLPFHGPLI